MTNRKGGYRRKTRALMKKQACTRGKISITRYLAEYNKDDQVILKAEPAVQKGIYHLRFYGKQGTILKKTGKCYEVKIKDGGKLKKLTIHPIHLVKV